MEAWKHGSMEAWKHGEAVGLSPPGDARCDRATVRPCDRATLTRGMSVWAWAWTGTGTGTRPSSWQLQATGRHRRHCDSRRNDAHGALRMTSGRTLSSAGREGSDAGDNTVAEEQSSVQLHSDAPHRTERRTQRIRRTVIKAS